jgi:hypothetical protein
MRLIGRSAHILLLSASAAWLAAVALVPSHAASHVEPAPKKVAKVDFSRDILPILSDKCFKCHGPDPGSRQADMRLDEPEGAFANRGGRFPIVPGKPQDSLVIKRINSKDSPMPPPYSGKSLTPEEKVLIAKWIGEGAKYEKLWSFVPLPAKVAVPHVNSTWPRNDIDRFILSRLNQEGLKPSAPASRQRWLRRVTLDLTGLPPTESEINAFAGDTRSDAYERVVDRLLSSPHYGERLAVDWLDAARYSDSYGYQSDLLMPTWPYRDWVIKAFNENLPYNRFLIDQLAGDLLPNPSRDERLATAFNRLHRQSNEGGSIIAEFKNEYAVDRVDTFGTAVLGLTVGCARCHDHKFDPITEREYYQLYAYFNNIDEYGLVLSTEIVPTPSLLLPTDEQAKTLAAAKAADATAKASLTSAQSSDDSQYEAWLATKPTKPEIPGVMGSFSLDSEKGGKFANSAGTAECRQIGKLESVPGHVGKAIEFDGDNGIAFKGLPGIERWDAFTWSFWLSDPRQKADVVLMHRTGGTDVGFCGFDVSLEDGYLTARVMRHWPGNAVAVRTKQRLAKDRWQHLAWSWDGSGRASGLRVYIDGKPVETEVLADTLWKNINAYGDLGPSDHDWSFAQRFRDAGFKGGKVEDVTFADRVLSPIEVKQLFDGNSLASALQNPAEHTADLRQYYDDAFSPAVRAAREQVKKSQMAVTNAENPIYEISVMQQAKKEIPAYDLARGAYDAPQNASTRVYPGVPKSLPPLIEPGPNNRLALARWATSPNHPLTARVVVNRLWQLVFGVGLVETTENLGMQGSQPTHPELLDYLARRFVNSGWNVKALLREMVLSSTYRQDSTSTQKLNKIDPDNQLYARGPGRRLSAEMIRDVAIAAAGLLNDKVGGAPVNPYQPAGIWTENNTMTNAFVQSKGADLYRRSIYSTWKRTTPVPSMMLFDATSREACVVRRPATDTPLQALVLLNDVQFVEAARVLAEHVLKEPADDAGRIRSAFVRLAGRAPDASEASILLRTLKEQRGVFAADPKSADKLIHFGDSKPDAALNPVDLAAMTVVAQTILNSDVVIWKR